MSRSTQNAAVLRVLQEGTQLTPALAYSLIGTMRLAARVWDLRQAGHDIETVDIQCPGGATVAGYRLLPPVICAGCGYEKKRCTEARARGAIACCPDCDHFK